MNSLCGEIGIEHYLLPIRKFQRFTHSETNPDCHRAMHVYVTPFVMHSIKVTSVVVEVYGIYLFIFSVHFESHRFRFMEDSVPLSHFRRNLTPDVSQKIGYTAYPMGHISKEIPLEHMLQSLFTLIP